MTTPTYRMKAFDAAGDTVAARGFMCADDAAALDLARKLTRSHPRVEVWAGERLVGAVAATQAQPEVPSVP